MRFTGASFLFLLVALVGGASAQPQARVCYSIADTRDKIISEKLVEPLALMRAQAGEHRAEVIGVRLCRVASSLVYEIDLLRHDGRLIHTRVDAATGKPLSAEAGR
jgi:uncharacterized membrane protein YkoI